jgi:diacylglycerol O-acyltransferase / wax synthase
VRVARPPHGRHVGQAPGGVQRTGPWERGRLGGAWVSEIYSTGVLSPGAPLNITVWSYVDQLGVAVLTDDRTFADPHEATDALSQAFSELRRAAGVSETLGSQNGIEGGVEQSQPIVGGSG